MSNNVIPVSDRNAKKLVDLIGDADLALFFVTWLKNGMNATKAYEELHPDVTHGSAKTLSARMLARVDRREIMSAYDLGEETYFKQLTEGIRATRRDQFSGEMYPDHKVRKDYHDKLGKLLGIEQERPSTLVQVNTGEGMGLEFFGADEGQVT